MSSDCPLLPLLLLLLLLVLLLVLVLIISKTALALALAAAAADDSNNNNANNNDNNGTGGSGTSTVQGKVFSSSGRVDYGSSSQVTNPASLMYTYPFSHVPSTCLVGVLTMGPPLRLLATPSPHPLLFSSHPLLFSPHPIILLP